MLYVEAYKNRFKIPEDSFVIDTTSRSTNWTRGFSPFILEGGHLYGEYYAKNVENLWQGAKTYKEHTDKDGNPTPEYFAWAKRLWESSYAERYPMGRGRKPEYSYWDGEKLDYIAARKKIYIPVYGRAMIKSKAFKRLLELYRTTERDIYLIDFDGYNHVKMNKSITEVVNDPTLKMGHAFVIYVFLEKYKNDPEWRKSLPL